MNRLTHYTTYHTALPPWYQQTPHPTPESLPEIGLLDFPGLQETEVSQILPKVPSLGCHNQIPPTKDHDCLAKGIKDAANVQAFSNLNLRKSRGTEKNSTG